MDELRFPDGFVWGAATSAFQIEGANTCDGRAPSIWDAYAARPGLILDGSNGSMACDHYHRYADDVRLLGTLGVQAYRFSVAWPRILPQGRGRVNEAGLDFYERLVDSLLKAGIQPYATLYHWDLPQILEEQGGWPSRHVAEAFVEYADVVTRRLGDRVKNWITHNEPWCTSILGYRQAEHAPGRSSWPDALAAAHHLLLSHGWTVPIIRSNARGARVGITLNLAPCTPASPSDADWDAAQIIDGEINRWFLDPIFRGAYPRDIVDHHELSGHVPDGMGFIRPGDLEVIKAPTDFLGVNYYTRAIIRSGRVSEELNEPRTVPEPREDQKTEMGWEVCPSGLTDLLIRLNADYAPGSFLITENGAAYGTGPDEDGRTRDRARQDYIDGHLRACRKAIDAGVPLEGYFVWSFLDNFEWAYGYTKRFGIVWIDFETQERIVKDSGYWYAKVAQRNALPAGPAV